MKHNSCIKCGKCCRFRSNDQEYSVIILPEDLNRISKKLKTSKSMFVQKYCNKHTLDIENELIDLYMLKSVDKSCVFLTDENLCAIYSYRPLQCQKAPYDFFANIDIWKDLPCIDLDYLSLCDSINSDEQIINEILKGYNFTP